MESIPIAVRLQKLQELLFHIAEDLDDMENVRDFPPDVILDVLCRRDAMIHRVLKLAEMASSLLKKTVELYWMAPAGTLTAPKLHGQPVSGSTNTATEFHRFPDLPPELRLMVWEAAALPPTCPRYIEQNGNPLARKRTVSPLTPFMADRGLWWACKESQDAIERVYSRCEDKVNATSGVLTGNAACTAPDDEFERHYHRLREFNRRASVFQRMIRRLYIEFRNGLDNLIPPTCAVRDLYTTRPDASGGLILVEPTIRVSTILTEDFALSSPHVTP